MNWYYNEEQDVVAKGDPIEGDEVVVLFDNVDATPEEAALAAAAPALLNALEIVLEEASLGAEISVETVKRAIAMAKIRPKHVQEI